MTGRILRSRMVSAVRLRKSHRLVAGRRGVLLRSYRRHGVGGDVGARCLLVCDRLHNSRDWLKRAWLNRAWLNRTRLNRAWVNRTRLNRAWVRLNRAWLNRTRLNRAWVNRTRLNRAWVNRTRLNRTRLNRAWVCSGHGHRRLLRLHDHGGRLLHWCGLCGSLERQARRRHDRGSGRLGPPRCLVERRGPHGSRTQAGHRLHRARIDAALDADLLAVDVRFGLRPQDLRRHVGTRLVGPELVATSATRQTVFGRITHGLRADALPHCIFNAQHATTQEP